MTKKTYRACKDLNELLDVIFQNYQGEIDLDASAQVHIMTTILTLRNKTDKKEFVTFITKIACNDNGDYVFTLGGEEQYTFEDLFEKLEIAIGNNWCSIGVEAESFCFVEE